MESTNPSQNIGVKGVVDRVRESASTQLSSQKDRATDSLGSLARAIRESTHSLRDHQHDTVAQYVEQAADRLDSFSATLRDRDMRQLMTDAEQFARRQPAVFIGASFMLGVLAARFLKSSAPAGHDWRARSSASESWTGGQYRSGLAGADRSGGMTATATPHAGGGL